MYIADREDGHPPGWPLLFCYISPVVIRAKDDPYPAPHGTSRHPLLTAERLQQLRQP